MGSPRTRSRRGAFFAAAFTLLTIGAMLQWWRSQSNFDSLRWGGFVAMTAQGKVCLLHSDAAPDGPVRRGLHTVPHTTANRGSTIVQWPSFSYSRQDGTVKRESKLTVVAPLWFVGALCAVPPAWWLTRGRRAARLADEMD